VRLEYALSFGREILQKPIVVFVERRISILLLVLERKGR
jgi:hypothetical protein